MFIVFEAVEPSWQRWPWGFRLATGSIVVATEAPAINPAVRPAVARPVLQVGSTGADVTAVQTRLGVSQTGYFGVLTAAAVTNFQRAMGLPLAARSAQRRGQSSCGQSSKSASSGSRPVLQMGSTGPAVSDLQRRLPMPMVTGYFGTMTDAYVRAAEKAKLRVSGIVGRRRGRSRQVKFKVKTVSSAATPAAAKPSGNLASQIMAIAASYKGIPYVANGYTPAQGFNCSSYTQWVYQRAGIDLGGAYTVTQYSRARKITKAEAKPGDLVFFYNYPNNFIGHVGIYAWQRNDVARTADRASGFARPKLCTRARFCTPACSSSIHSTFRSVKVR